ncbi:MAG TPA: excinuclease ABC subunit UvrB [Victivallales bacterium]|nr:excinuclease ABC subunit UvrB [Victivallales bacterium]
MFKLESNFKPSGDQPEAIINLVSGLKTKNSKQVLLGVTGSGKTFTMANVIQEVQRPILIVSHNKTLAAQLYSEFKSYFPDNAVEFFISYYDYYLPESYIPQTDTYIAKDSSINDEIEKLRLSATTSLMTRKDVIIIASVSCIYGLGSPDDYKTMSILVRKGQTIDRRKILSQLIDIQYERNDISPEAGQFRVSGDVIDVYFSHKNEFVRIEMWGKEIENITNHNTVTANKLSNLKSVIIPPVKHFVLPKEKIDMAEESIKLEMQERVKYFENENRLVEAQRIYQRTKYDLEMLKEIGYCSGIENYSRHLTGRPPGSRPYCLIDFFPKNFIVFIDESHVTIPQLRAMYNADQSRKQTLVDHGFRLPSALDNRPLSFEEFNHLTHDIVFVSATPSEYEIDKSDQVVEQVVRPTGLLDPELEIRALDGQVDDVIGEIKSRAKKNERSLVTTLTKKSSEKLSDYLIDIGIRAKYLHSEIDTIQRVEILTALRKNEFDCLIGVNLLREGLDLPEVSLVAILDADKEGFLRSEKALTQTAGRAARHSEGKVILYANKITPSMDALIKLTEKRRKRQINYNTEHDITPKTIIKELRDDLTEYSHKKTGINIIKEEQSGYYSDEDSKDLIEILEKEMLEAAATLEFERAAQLRDKLKDLKNN